MKPKAINPATWPYRYGVRWEKEGLSGGLDLSTAKLVYEANTDALELVENVSMVLEGKLPPMKVLAKK